MKDSICWSLVLWDAPERKLSLFFHTNASNLAKVLNSEPIVSLAKLYLCQHPNLHSQTMFAVWDMKLIIGLIEVCGTEIDLRRSALWRKRVQWCRSESIISHEALLRERDGFSTIQQPCQGEIQIPSDRSMKCEEQLFSSRYMPIITVYIVTEREFNMKNSVRVTCNWSLENNGD